MFWKCKHPAMYLVVEREATEEKIDEDFTDVVYHLFCIGCNENVDIKYARCNGGVEEFLNRRN